MSFTSIGDLAQSLQLRRDTARLNDQLVRVAGEVSAGRVSDPVARLGGDTAPLAFIERTLERAETRLRAAAEFELETEARQAALGQIQDRARDLGETLITLPDGASPGLTETASADARLRLGAVLSALNTAIGGRTLFAGTATDGPAVVPAADMLAAVASDVALADATTAGEVGAVVDAWFAPGGGFEASGYVGSGDDLGRLALSDGERAAAPPRADDPSLRATLAALVKAALVSEGVLSGSPEEAARLLRDAGLGLIAADGGLVELRVRIGSTEEQVLRARTELRSERDAAELARDDLIGIDAFEAASELQAVELRLQAIYALTARLSRLSLTEYL